MTGCDGSGSNETNQYLVSGNEPGSRPRVIEALADYGIDTVTRIGRLTVRIEATHEQALEIYELEPVTTVEREREDVRLLEKKRQ